MSTMSRRLLIGSSLFLLTSFPETSYAIGISENFPDKKAVIINNCPFIELSGFSFENRYESPRNGLHTDLSWKNTGNSAIIAFEVVIIMYDPFNRAIPTGGRWLIPGTDSANWAPLLPGHTGKDGLIDYSTQFVYTGFVYVRSARLSDGSIWTSDQKVVEAAIRAKLPEVKDFSTVNPQTTKDKDNT